MIALILLVVSLFSLSLACVLVFVLHCAVNDRAISHYSWDAKKCKKLFAVFAHPDDEVMVSGTLAKVKKHGGEVHLLYFTHGEDGPTGDITTKENLALTRKKELDEVASVIRANSIEVLHFPDRHLNTIDVEILKDEARRRIEFLKPDTVICFDKQNGLYGHDDHIAAGKSIQNLLGEDNLGVEDLLIMTLPNKMISLATKISSTFRERYDDKNGLPRANLSVKMSRYSAIKYSVVKCHKTQWQVMNDVQPLHNKLPHFIYYRIFSREYYNHTPFKKQHER